MRRSRKFLSRKLTGVTGRVVLFLCYNPAAPITSPITAPAGVPTPPLCPTTSPASVTGTLTEANVIALPGQGIDPGAAGLAEMIKAIKNGAPTLTCTPSSIRLVK
jgi:hypothetical protein